MPSPAAPAARAWLLAPLYFGQLFTGAKSFESNPLIGSARLNALGLHERRVLAAYRRAEARRETFAPRVARRDRDAFARDGFVVRRDFLSPQDFARLRAEVEAYRGGMEERLWGETVNRKLLIDRRVADAMPSLRAVVDAPEWRDLIAYVGACASPPLAYLQSLYRRGGAADPQTHLHVDTFHATAKAWLFLTDVRAGEGAFTYVPGSHRLTPEKLAWHRHMSLTARDSDDKETREGSFRIDPADLPALGLPPPIELAVPANTLIVADTSGFHARGPSVAGSLRVEIWGLGRRQPFLSSQALERWDTRTLGSFVRAAERLRRGSPWTFKPGLGAFDGATRP